MRKLQIGVMGSAADLQYSKRLEKLAMKVGQIIATNNIILIFGAEKDVDSLSTIAARAANSIGGFTVGITYGQGLEVFETTADLVIASGLERGGGRELTLVLSCDVIITIGGGSGTLTEIAIAYQAGIPIVCLANSGGWSQKLQNSYLDERKRIKILSATTPEEAVELAISLTNRK